MSRPLPDNPEHLHTLCDRLHLGVPAGRPSRVHGGLQHRMWRLDTDRSCYAVKQLSREVNLESAAATGHYNTSEAVAEAFAAGGVPAVAALQHQGEYLQLIDGQGYLVYPWRDARALAPDQLTERPAATVAAILAKMHRLNLEFPCLRRHDFDAHARDNIVWLVDLAVDAGLPFADTLRKVQPSFLEIVDAQAAAMRQLGHRLVVSHGDLDPKNVLWDAQERPAIIDWESATRLNPTYELLLEALNWSGAGQQFQPEIFGRFLTAYREAGGLIDRADARPAYVCVLGDWVYWLMYNLGRCLKASNANDRSRLERQVGFALAALQRIMDHVPGLLPNPDPAAGNARQIRRV